MIPELKGILVLLSSTSETEAKFFAITTLTTQDSEVVIRHRQCGDMSPPSDHCVDLARAKV
jgi:hypothetical protein